MMPICTRNCDTVITSQLSASAQGHNKLPWQVLFQMLEFYSGSSVTTNF